MSRKRLMKLSATVAVTSIALLVGYAAVAHARGAGNGPIVAPGSTPTTAPCVNHGTIVAMVYASWGTDLPASGSCWTVVKPRTANLSSYTNCNVSGTTPSKQGSGSAWTYDDINVNGHHGSTDATLNSTYCSGHQAYFFEFMASSGGFHWAWNPTFTMEENYDSSHNFLAYTLTTTKMPGYSGTASSYNPVPTLDANSSTVATNIGQVCYDSPDFSSDYYIGIYNGSPVSSATESAIVSALNSCYH